MIRTAIATLALSALALGLALLVRRSLRKAGRQVLDRDKTATKKNEPYSGSGPFSMF